MSRYFWFTGTVKIRIYSIGRVRQDFVRSGEDEFLTRLKSWAKIELIEIAASAAEAQSEAAKEEEAARVLAKVSAGEFLFVLDELGKALSSKELAVEFSKLMNRGQSDISFAIGGFHGWSETIMKRANFKLSLSRFTFTYQMSRLILVEQLYRVSTIIKGVPYHK